MNIVRYSVIALLGLAAPTALVAQDKLVARGGAGFNLTVDGQVQGAFSGKGGIAGSRFSHGLRSPRDAASGLPTGKRQHSPVTFTKVVGIASPQFFAAMTKNENLKSVVVSVPGGEGGRGYRIKLTNANISEIKQYTEIVNGQATVLEDVSFTYQKIEVEDLGTGTVAADDWESPVS